jgi:multiple sugar transport system permease protein
MRRQRIIGRTFSYIFLTIGSLIMIYPVLFMVLGTFTDQRRFLEASFLPIPNTLNGELFWLAINYGLGHSYLITLYRCIWYIAVNIGVSLIAGYIFSKLRFPGRNKIFLLFLSGMVMPGILMLVPSYLLMAWFPLAGGNNILGQGGHGFIQHWPVLFIGGWVPVFWIFLFKQNYDMLPAEYEDAAKMDGAGLWTIIFRVYGPLLKPPMVALIIMTFIGTWNDYLWPALTVSGVTDLWVIAYRIQYVTLKQGVLGIDTTNFPEQMLKTFMATWPPAVVFFAFQRYFVQGMTMSGLKG